jgi:ABC-type nitrate/sulfonate/bicarbonate transport system permease component
MTAAAPIRLLRGLALPVLLIALWQVAASQVQQPSQAPTPLRVILGAEALTPAATCRRHHPEPGPCLSVSRWRRRSPCRRP